LHSDVVTDLADNPLDGGQVNGDFTVGFQVSSTFTNVDVEPNDTASTAQPLGALYPTELARGGVAITGELSSATGPSGDHDFYRFRLLLPELYTFRLRPTGGSTETGLLSVRDDAGTLKGSGSTLFLWLEPGEYVAEIAGQPGGQSPELYRLTISVAIPEIP